MIVPMDKLWLVCREADRKQTLDALGDLGVLHVTPVTPPEESAVQASRDWVVALEQALAALPADGAVPVPESCDAVNDIVDRITLYQEERDRVFQEIQDRRREIRAIEPFGDFDPALVKTLSKNAISVQLVRYQRKQPPEIPSGAQLHVLTEMGGDAYGVVIAKGESLDLDCAVALPRQSLASLNSEQAAAEKRLAVIEDEMASLVPCRPVLTAALEQAQADARMQEVAAGMGTAGELLYLQGYCPKDQTVRLQEAARDAGWGLLVKPPGADEEVPTLIRNPKWIQPIKSVFDMIGLMPGYREIDISGVFLIFFSLFFAILIGDAGYGMLFLLMTIAARRKWRTAPAYPFTLLKILSVCTIAWGVITGNYFGVTSLPAPLSSLTVEWLRGEQSDHNLMLLCFLIGAIHLSVAHAWNAVRLINHTRALAQIGWILLTWTMFLTARTMILGAEFPRFGIGLLGVGLALVFLFMTTPKEFRKDWPNHVMLPLDVISNFVDVVSYVRLFAVGSASLAVASAFNEMALGNGIPSIWAGLGAAVVLFFGHTLNILLCAMGILVHGVRLNTLEFSGHIGMQWTGIPFAPFVRRRQLKQQAERN